MSQATRTKADDEADDLTASEHQKWVRKTYRNVVTAAICLAIIVYTVLAIVHAQDSSRKFTKDFSACINASLALGLDPSRCTVE